MNLINNDIELKECTFEDFEKVYEYDFSKLTNIWQDMEFEKNSPERIKELFDGINNELNNQNNTYNWIIYYKDIPVGQIIADKENKKMNNSIELSYNLHPDYWGKGIMKETIQLVCDYLFKKYDNIIISYCTGNEKSKRLLDKLNFKQFNINNNAYSREGKSVDEFQYVLNKKGTNPNE